MENTKLRLWINNFNHGCYDDTDTRMQIRAGWFDWFCKASSLNGKTKKLGSVVKQIKDGGKVDLDESYVFFKNNCPLEGPLFDDFRICDIDNGSVRFTVRFDCVWEKTKYAVYGKTPDGVFHSEEPIFATDSKRELVKWLNTPWEASDGK